MAKRTVIVGAGMAGMDVYREIRRSPGLNIKVVGFVDDDSNKLGLRVNGIRVLGDIKNLKLLIQSKRIDEVIIAIPSANGERIQEYVKICSEAKVSFRVVPRVKEIIEGKAYVGTLRKPRLEDLLGRPVVKGDVVGLKNFFQGRTVLITGAAGSIGSELSRQVAAYKPKQIVFFDWWENGMYELELELVRMFPRGKMEFVIGNIQDEKRVFGVMQSLKPDYVFHAAAYKHVPAMENNPTEAVKNNVFGTLCVARAAKKCGVGKFVIVSTDKAARPKSVMGATKLVTEVIGKNLNSRNGTNFMAVRFGNVLGSYGSVVPIFEKQIQEGGPVTVTDKRMTRYFMTIPEAAQLILKAALIGQGGELFVLDMGYPVKIVDLAENMIRLHGLIPYKDVDIIFTGIRKGEKLHERLFNDRERLIKTEEEKIFVTESLGLEAADLVQLTAELGECVSKNKVERIRKVLHEYIPSVKQRVQ